MKKNKVQRNNNRTFSIRKKTILIFIMFFVIMITVGFVLLFELARTSFNTLEIDSVNNNLAILEKAFNNRLDNLVFITKDYAVWDASYDFVQGNDDNYVENNLPDSIFSSLEINFLLYTNSSGETFYAKSMDFIKKEETNDSAEVLRILSDLNELKNTDSEHKFQGVIILAGKPMLIGSYPILKNDGNGPVKGNVFIGRYMDDSMIEEISENLGMSTSLEIIDSKSYQMLQQSDIGEKNPLTEIIFTNPKLIEASVFIPSYKQSAIKLVMQIPRGMHLAGDGFISAMLIFFTVFLITVFLVLLILINKIIIIRLANLQKAVISITESEDISKRIEISGENDEILYLAKHINNMLDVTEDLVVSVKCINNELDVKVLERTKELLNTNTELSIEREKISHVAYHDNLTGLPNGVHLHEIINKAINVSNNIEMPIAILFLDLDGFKMINDTLGHSAGDELLILVANRLVSILRENDTVARIGGDEFIILIDPVKCIESLNVIAARFLKAFSLPFVINDQECFVSASIGIALHPVDGKTSEELIKNADLAMYKAKENGKNQFCYCNQQMKDQITENMILSNQLWRGLDKNEFELYYQPQINCITKEIVGFEALLRWNHFERGMICPDDFISLAEQTGAIIPIGEWVLNKALDQCKIWQEKYFFKFRMAVNVSVKQLQNRGIFNQVEKALEKTGLDPSTLELEITENIIMKDTSYAVEVLNELKGLGIEIAIDDFGTKYASMSYLKHLPVDKIKIAMTFVQGIDVSEKDQAIIKTLIMLAKNMGMNIIAEGVETKSQYDFLTQISCDEIQGYYFYKPMSVYEIEEMLNHRFCR